MTEHMGSGPTEAEDLQHWKTIAESRETEIRDLKRENEAYRGALRDAVRLIDGIDRQAALEFAGWLRSEISRVQRES